MRVLGNLLIEGYNAILGLLGNAVHNRTSGSLTDAASCLDSSQDRRLGWVEGSGLGGLNPVSVSVSQI